MKEKIYNFNNIKEEDINDKVVRVKALIVNDKKEILLCSAFGTIQFPGGHLEKGEDLTEALNREIKEETGLILDTKLHTPFLAIKYYMKDYPVIAHNRSIEIYYYYFKTNQKYNINLLNLDDQERNGDFQLFYVPIKKVKSLLKKNLKKQEINKVIYKEMMQALKIMRKEVM